MEKSKSLRSCKMHSLRVKKFLMSCRWSILFLRDSIVSVMSSRKRTWCFIVLLSWKLWQTCPIKIRARSLNMRYWGRQLMIKVLSILWLCLFKIDFIGLFTYHVIDFRKYCSIVLLRESRISLLTPSIIIISFLAQIRRTL